MPTPAISTAVAMPTGTSAALRSKRVGHHLASLVVDVHRHESQPHRHAELEAVEVRLGDPRDELQALGKLDNAEAERHLAGVPRGPVDHRGEQTQAAALAERTTYAPARAAIGTVVAGWKMIAPAARAKAAEQAAGAVGLELEQPARDRNRRRGWNRRRVVRRGRHQWATPSFRAEEAR